MKIAFGLVDHHVNSGGKPAGKGSLQSRADLPGALHELTVSTQGCHNLVVPGPTQVPAQARDRPR